MIKRILNALWNNFEDYVSAVALLMMVTILFAQVCTRFIFHGALTWAEETSRFGFIWMMFLASSLAAKHRSHIRVTAVLLLIPKKWRIRVIFCVDILWTGFNIIMVFLGMQMFMNALKFKYLSPALKIDMAWMFLVIPVAFLLMSIRIVVGYINMFTGKEKGYEF